MSKLDTIRVAYPNAYCVKNAMSKNYVVYDGPDTKERKKKALGTGHCTTTAYENAIKNLKL